MFTGIFSLRLPLNYTCLLFHYIFTSSLTSLSLTTPMVVSSQTSVVFDLLTREETFETFLIPRQVLSQNTPILTRS